ncbi:SpaH/EbpB family LPXTG-anchored major pilin [Faecalicatena fissicatena]|jgi:fimbrial isopeptide formation D2 family protein/LPXTG-motif cell wall-anchored protein|uniref:SpaH/EbpB family LPXTG-anchored major pilin n=1 Tax=Faecalicatena fissicatena TaxID=290055 RepID=A0ABX2H2T4_9FIRM|nr:MULTISPECIES: SpaH/EbpB family LPXTG-anchored major pilin [Clostridia]MBT9653718.1 SpaH/EbpB family LPXTG-anchored major pilin [Ruminococcus sp. MCC718]MCB5867265.1 SpaH/EbpB family LPXTG-anchored major pilin [Faecalicatena fissicatena]NSD83788.1 SpaH/EbpB family LPXTG-anchored major pilin [Faecalicatena fissicatena]NSE55012.1 SpaH/EbpB family LPXTG-anchored major pilin [Faecalicatena fissicatena]NSE65101.1 SpaH/EbpB family LPXTG-anchored major pilin [Faecalicatena fissicatena]
MKKLVSRFMAVLMAMTMILSMSMTAFAAEAPKGTLTVNNTVAGKTLDLYQIFTATKNEAGNVAYTLNSAYEGFFQSKISGASTLTGEALSEKAYNYVKDQVGTDGSNGAAFAKDILDWILKNATTVATTHTTANTTADTTVINNLDYGYYVVYPLGATDTSTAPGNEKVKSVASLVSVTGIDATVNMKSNYPTVDKKIIPAQSGSGITIGAIVNGNWEGNHQMELDDENESEDTIAPHGATDEKKVGDFGIGDTVTYQLTSKVPDMTGYNSYTFKFSDTLSKGLDLKEVLSVKVGNTTLTAKSTGANTYALAYDKSNRTLTVTLNDFYNSYKNRTGDTITVVYTATLNRDAVIGMNPNTNKAVVEYSNNPKSDGTGKSEPSIVDVHTFDFTIFKYYLKDETQTGLANAEFELYKANEAGDAADTNAKINIVDEGNGVYRQATADEAKATGFTSAKIVSDADGKVLVKGLDAGTYYLRETKAPEGYNKLLSDIKVEIKPVYDETTGKLTSYSVDYTYNGKTTNGAAITNKTDSPEVAVENKTGAQLPSTGSKGALMVTLAGIVLFGALTASKAFGKKKANN